MTTRCWHCDRAIDDTDRYCRSCGEGQGDALTWYYRPVWILVLALTVLGPFAIVPIIRTPRMTPAAKWGASIALVVFSIWYGIVLWREMAAVLEM